MSSTDYTERKFRASSGNTYTKEVTSDGSTRFRKNGQFCSPNAYSGASQYEEAEIIGGDVAVPLPTYGPDGVSGFKREQVEYGLSQRLGEAVNNPVDGEEIFVNGTWYPETDIAEAYDMAEDEDGEAVRGSD